MPTNITMPQLGESVSEGTVGRWLKQEGDTVKRDESLVEIITDKVTAELPSPVSGQLVKILVKEDETVKVGTPIAEVEEGAGAGTSGTGGSTSAGAATAATPAPAGATAGPAGPAGNGYGGPAAQAGSNGGGAVAASTAIAPRATSTTERPDKVSPLARRLAQEHNIDLSAIQGTGEGGRVRKEDILDYIGQQAGQPAAAVATTAAPVAPPAVTTAPVSVPSMEGDQVITPSPARRAIAEHMVRSKQTSPHATTLVEVDMTNLARWLERNKDEFKQREGYGIGYQTFAIKATVESLREYPYMNASWSEDNKIVLRKQINIGVSIALENNLIVPVIRNADALSIAGIARAVNDLVTRARSNRLMPGDLQGSTFTVNNPGVFGTLMSMAIINQPNAAILTMDGVFKRPVVVDDAIAIRHMMYMSLSFDHRILDGLTAAQFLNAVKRRLEGFGPDIEVY
jgi:pyruvate/2-oxoglutarate dehydrogenase complex dihydrolipoamide acyltransferase (E2) component